MSVYNIKIDFKKSKGSHIYDKNTKKSYLDFMGMYSSLPLGYNHYIFDSFEFKKETRRMAPLKIVNCEINSDEYESFFEEFKKFTSLGKYSRYFFTCTGSLANEAAIKTAMWYKGTNENGYVLSIKNSFHGINSFGNLITTRFNQIRDRQGNIFGENVWKQAEDIKDAIKIVKQGDKNLQGVIVEPIQATYGDNYFYKKDLMELREYCYFHDIPLIFDEVQTGFGTTGSTWFFEKVDIEPDIVVFGKKSQVSGIMVKEKFSKIFEIPKRLSVTFDGDLIDMVRCKYIIQAIKKDKLLRKAIIRGGEIKAGLEKFSELKNVRGVGLLIAFDFENKKQRDAFYKEAYFNGLLCNPTRLKTIRIRPNLAVSREDVNLFLKIVEKSLKNIKNTTL